VSENLISKIEALEKRIEALEKKLDVKKAVSEALEEYFGDLEKELKADLIPKSEIPKLIEQELEKEDSPLWDIIMKKVRFKVKLDNAQEEI